MPITHRNHYVPCMYLKHFADSQERIATYRLLVSKVSVKPWKRTHVSAVGYQRDLYTRSVFGVESDQIERWLNQDFENPAEEALNKVHTDAELTSTDWKRLVSFLASQIVRTPAFFIGMLPIWNRTLPSAMKETFTKARTELRLAKIAGRPLEIPSVSNEFNSEFPMRVYREDLPEEKVAKISAEVLVGRGLWIWAMKRMLSTTINVLHQHHWSIFHAGAGLKFFTSDDPVVRLNYHSASRYDFGGGWNNKGTEIILPLSPRHVLYTKIGERFPPRAMILSLSEMRLLREVIAKHAHRYLFASSEDSEILMLQPRIVNADIVNSENAQWRKWHDNQDQAEEELRSGLRPQVSP
jgi:Protein of unknown function (DUF4238)